MLPISSDNDIDVNFVLGGGVADCDGFFFIGFGG